jgi:hypothetical protein
MKPASLSLGIAIGLFLLSASFIVKHIWPTADFADGFMKGLGITLMIGLLIKQRRLRHS